MTEFLVKALRDWLKVRSTYAEEGERALFVNYCGGIQVAAFEIVALRMLFNLG
jgi:hypothetical protein